jgi:hypothetical protein
MLLDPEEESELFKTKCYEACTADGITIEAHQDCVYNMVAFWKTDPLKKRKQSFSRLGKVISMFNNAKKSLVGDDAIIATLPGEQRTSYQVQTDICNTELEYFREKSKNFMSNVSDTASKIYEMRVDLHLQLKRYSTKVIGTKMADLILKIIENEAKHLQSLTDRGQGKSKKKGCLETYKEELRHFGKYANEY